MLVIGERINATRKRIARAIEQRDAEHLQRVARRQAEVGADFIDVNAATDPAGELENLKWAVQVVQDSTELPLCIDSASAEGFRQALDIVRGDEVMLNSVNGERERIRQVIPLAAGRGTRLVGLLMDERGLPTGVDDRLEIARRIVNAAAEAGIPAERLYLDPCVQPLSTSPDQAQAVLSSVRRIVSEFPGIHATCGLSNISFGLPYRGIVNRVCLALLIDAGLDSAIIDPTEPDVMATVYAAEALAGRDEFCMNYITADRQGKLRPKGE